MEIQRRYSTVVNGFAVTLPQSELERLEDADGVAHVYPSVAYRAQRSSSPGFIGATTLWGSKLATAGGGMKIGIIDDGIDSTHPYFKPKGYRMPRGFPKGQKKFTTAKVIVARAFAPRTPKYRYANRPFDPLMSEHATHVAGIAAGNYRTPARGSRISGVAPKAYLGNYKVLTIPTPGFGLNGNSPEIVAAIEAAVRDGMDVINLSIGEAEIDPSRDIVAAALDAAAAAGVVPVVAAGNSFDELGAGSITSPATSARAISVAAEAESGAGELASFSSGGPTPLSLRMKPDVTAPGVAVLSSVPRREGTWQSFSGTSMAAPHVAGAAALLRQRHRGWSVEQLKSALVQTGRPVSAGTSEAEADTTREGGGTVNLVRANSPLLFTSPTGLSFGFVRPGASTALERRADRRGRRQRSLDRGDLGTAARRRFLGERSARGQRSRGARGDSSGRAKRDPGRALGIRRPDARSGAEAHPVLVPRRRARARSRSDHAACGNRHLQRRHSGPSRARRHVPLSGGSPRARRGAHAARAGGHADLARVQVSGEDEIE